MSAPRPAQTRTGFTLIEMLVAITIFTVLSLLVTYVFRNVSRVSERTQVLMQLHHEASAVLRTIEADLQQLQPHTAMRLAEFPGDVTTSPTTAAVTHLTFMRTHGDTENQSQSHTQGGESGTRGSYQHELLWVRWQADKGGLRRAASPEWPQSKLGGVGSDSGYVIAYMSAETSIDTLHTRLNNEYDGLTPTPQQFYEFFEPPTLPERATGATGAFPLATPGARALDTDVYPWPSMQWWLPAPLLEHNRGEPGTPMRIDLGEMEDLGRIRAGEVTFLNDPLLHPYYGDITADERVAFAVTNERGYTVNRDFINLVGVHPDAHDERQFPSRLEVLNERILNFRVALFDAATGTALLPGGSDTPLAATAYAGWPMTPSENNLLSNSLTPSQRPDSIDDAGVGYGYSRGFDDRPVKAEIAFVIHDMPVTRLDVNDHDGDSDTSERLSQAIYDRLAKDNGLPVDDQDLIEAFNDANHHVAIAFRHAVILPH